MEKDTSGSVSINAKTLWPYSSLAFAKKKCRVYPNPNLYSNDSLAAGSSCFHVLHGGQKSKGP